MKVISADDNRIHDNFAMYLELTDIELAFIQEQPAQFFTIEWVTKLMKSKGNNAHIMQLTLNDDVSINKYVSSLLEKYDSVSWYNREHEFHIKKREERVCHL